MKIYTTRGLAAMLMICFLISTIHAQEKPKFRLDAGDAAFWAGSATDIATSVGKREAGVFHNEQGRFAVGPNLAMKGGIWGAFKLLEWKYPERRRTIMWTKIAAGSAFFCVGFFHNRGVKR